MMTQQELDKSIQEVWALFRETTQMFKETDKKIEKMSAKIEKVGEHVDGLAGSWGKFVEGTVAPGAIRMFKERDIDVEWTSTRNKVQKDGEEMEIDVLLENEEYVVAIEVKSTLNVEEVNGHLNRLKRFKEFFPRFKDHKLVGAVAGIVIEEKADRYAYRKGLFVIAQTGETVQILNDEKFKPEVW